MGRMDDVVRMEDNLGLGIKGEVAFWLLRGDACVRHERKKNLIVNLSRPFLADLARGMLLSAPIGAIAIGTGSTAPSLTDTVLVNEVYRMAMPAPGTDTPLQANVLLTSPTQIVFRQTLTPFVASSGRPTSPLVGTQVITEFGLFGDILAITTPTAAATISSQNGTGTVPNNNFNIKYTWVNDIGETAPSPAVAHTQSVTGSFTINLGPAPTQATKARLYIENVTAAPGTFWRFGTDISPLPSSGNVTFTVSTNPPTFGTAAPSTNTSVAPGNNGSGRLFNRALIGSPGGVSMSGTDRLMIESILTFG